MDEDRGQPPVNTGNDNREVESVRLETLLEATGDGMWDWDLQTGLAWLSPGYYRMTGYRPEDVTPDLDFYRRLVHPGDWPRVWASLQAALAGDMALNDLEYRVVRADGELRWARGWGSVVVRDPVGMPLRMIGLVSDITARKLREEALAASESRYRAEVEDLSEVIGRVATDGTILFVNQVYCRLFNRRLEDVLGTRWQPDVPAEDLPLIETGLAHLSPGNPVVEIENRVRTGTGELRWMQWVNRGIFDANGNLREVQAVGRDVHDRKLTELKLMAALEDNHRLSQAMVRLQEKERAELARELHDGLSQELTAIRIFAGAIRRGGRSAGQVKDDAAAIEESAGRIYRFSHRIMEGLHPHLLDSAGLEATVREFLDTWPARPPGLCIRLRFGDGDAPLSPEARAQCFRVIQECLSNVALHAGARRVRIFLGQQNRDGRLWQRMVVSDDGTGCPEPRASDGIGIALMRERVTNLGGVFQAGNGRQRGFRISARVPADG